MTDTTNTPIAGRIIRLIDDHTAVLNVGLDAGVTTDMRFAIYTPVEMMIDPDTKEELGGYKRRKGVLIVDEIAQRFCVASAPTVKEQITEDIGFLGFGTGRTRKRTVIVQDLNVAHDSVAPMPSGDEVRVGDAIEEIPRR